MNISKIIVLAVALLIAARAQPALACASLGPPETRVSIVDESAVIVWDASRQTQHFIRSATFDSNGHSVGFIVPTPSVPELAEADIDVFSPLETTIRPEVVYKDYSAYRLASYLIGGQAGSEPDEAGSTATTNAAAGAARDSVEVIRTQKVGGYDATILRATDAGALNQWLRRHDYQSNAAFEKWLAYYVCQGWIVTAFKVRKTDDGTPRFSSNLVRMSFKTPHPFFPYREPQQAAQGDEKRSLRIFFFAPSRVQATPALFGSQKNWPGKTKWADDTNRHGFTERSQWQWIAGRVKLPESTLKQARWMTVFEDTSTPRPGTNDVFFQSAANTTTLPPPVIVPRPVDKPIYIEFILLAIIVVVAAWNFYQGYRGPHGTVEA